jgi:hypothetical protein
MKIWRHFLTFVPCLLFAIFASAQADTARVEFGPELTQIYFPFDPVGSVQYQPGFGAFGSLRLYKTLSLDSSFTITPTVPITGTSYVGGRLTQAFLGVRAGLSKGRIDLDAKVRPGLASFGQVVLRVAPPPNPQFLVGRLTEPSLDIGGVVEVRISRRFAVRYEMGDTMIFYGTRKLFTNRPPVAYGLVNTLQFGTGFAFRF